MVNILNKCLCILIDCKTLQNLLRRTYRRTKITHKASDTAENLQLYRVVRFFRPRSSCKTMHISADIQRITLNMLCMTISGGRTEQLDIFCHITGFMIDFLSFIVVEHIRFFHGALHMVDVWTAQRTLTVLHALCLR